MTLRARDDVPRDSLQRDLLLRGRVVLWQTKAGYRTSVDAMLLAFFAAELGDAQRIVDLGAGSGLVAILLAKRFRNSRVHLLEKQPALAEIAQLNARENGIAHRAHVQVHDLCDGVPPPLGTADLVVCNPPYHRRKGRIVPTDPQRRDAHYESTATIGQFAACARALLHEEGTSCWIYPHATRSRLLEALVQAGLGRCDVHEVHHRPGHTPITRVLVAARRSDSVQIREQAAIALHPAAADDSSYTPRIERFLAALGASRRAC